MVLRNLSYLGGVRPQRFYAHHLVAVCFSRRHGVRSMAWARDSLRLLWVPTGNDRCSEPASRRVLLSGQSGCPTISRRSLQSTGLPSQPKVASRRFFNLACSRNRLLFRFTREPARLHAM